MKRASATCAVLVVLLGIYAAGCSIDRQDPLFDNPFDPEIGAGLPLPDSVVVAVGDNLVRLTWRLPEGEEADEYAVFRQRTDIGSSGEGERLLGRVTGVEYTDTSVRNGGSYAYRIAVGIKGQFGPRTEKFEAKPGVFSLVLADDADVTRDRSISVSFNAAHAEAVQLSEDPLAFTGPWRPAAGSISWTLSSGDGTKSVYGRFRFTDSSLGVPVVDMIRLDTRAVIESVDFDGSDVRRPGDTIHFRIVAGEPNGSATIGVDGVFEAIAAFDDGTSGDAIADDGIYERDLVIPATASVHDEEVRAEFTDEVGNTASPVTSPRLLSVLRAPESVELIELRVSEPPDAPAVTIRWSRSLDESFSAYRIFRAETAPVDSTDEMAGSIPDASTLSFEDSDVVEGETYHYRVFVQSDLGQETGSNTLTTSIPNERPPDAVTIDSPVATSTDRVALTWSASDAMDFASYRLYRNSTGAVNNTDSLLVEITNVNQAFWDDISLRENSSYFYRVYTVDHGDLTSRSNEVEAVTQNEAPPSVTLNEPADVDTSAATLSWTESQIHDFAHYQLYRDVIPTVTTGSTLVIEMDDSSFVSFRDTELEPDTQYYFRVFVVDDADDAESTGSNTVGLMTR